MPEPVVLISSEKITKEEFLAFLKRLGAEIKPDKVYDGVIRRGNASVWINLNPQDMTGYPDTEEECQIIWQKLGSTPQSYILLDISPESENLGIEIARKFAEQWRGVVDNLDGSDWKVFSVQELDELEISGKGFL